MTRDSKRDAISRKSGGLPSEIMTVEIIRMRGKKAGMNREFKDLSEWKNTTYTWWLLISDFTKCLCLFASLFSLYVVLKSIWSCLHKHIQNNRLKICVRERESWAHRKETKEVGVGEGSRKLGHHLLHICLRAFQVPKRRKVLSVPWELSSLRVESTFYSLSWFEDTALCLRTGKWYAFVKWIKYNVSKMKNNSSALWKHNIFLASRNFLQVFIMGHCRCWDLCPQ